jgi:hypothetical protein
MQKKVRKCLPPLPDPWGQIKQLKLGKIIRAYELYPDSKVRLDARLQAVLTPIPEVEWLVSFLSFLFLIIFILISFDDIVVELTPRS